MLLSKERQLWVCRVERILPQLRGLSIKPSHIYSECTVVWVRFRLFGFRMYSLNSIIATVNVGGLLNVTAGSEILPEASARSSDSYVDCKLLRMLVENGDS